MMPGIKMCGCFVSRRIPLQMLVVVFFSLFLGTVFYLISQNLSCDYWQNGEGFVHDNQCDSAETAMNIVGIGFFVLAVIIFLPASLFLCISCQNPVYLSPFKTQLTQLPNISGSTGGYLGPMVQGTGGVANQPV